MPIHGYPGNIITANPTAPTVSAASGVWTTEQQLQAVSQGNWPGYEYPISRSLRFNSADSAYLNRTPASASNRKTWTWSGWVKRSGLASTQTIFSGGDGSSNNDAWLRFDSGDTISFQNLSGGSYTAQVTTSAVFRDPSSWYHIILAIDTTQATGTNRVKIYVNNVQQTVTFTTTPSQNADMSINIAGLHTIGRLNYSAVQYHNGYMTEVNFIDGQALTPSSFGLNDPETGIWSPKAYTGTYGTNGFYLNFSDNSNTTSTTLGKDYSGNGNNWTPNNFSVTAGAGNDSLVDTPTSYGTDTGVGGEVRGNYCTLNPLQNTSVTLSNGNLQATYAPGSWVSAQATMPIPKTGKWKYEVTPTTMTYGFLAIVKPSSALTGTSYNNTNNYAWYLDSGEIRYSGTNLVTVTAASANDICEVRVDNGTVSFYRNGTLQHTFTQLLTDISDDYFPAVYIQSGAVHQYNFGQRPFAYTPSGFKALCTQNLPTPTIGATSTTQANDYFNAVLYTGNGSTQSITGVGFQPDLVWLKSRSNAYDHILTDAVRGATKELKSNSTAAEGTAANGLTAFNSDGFSVGSTQDYNANLATYVAWNWNAGGSNATNTSGTITSTVRASTTAGFSIVTATAPAAAAQGTVGHGLGVTPSMIFLKTRSTTYNWSVYHASVCDTTSKYLRLNDTSALLTYSTVWGAALPTSSVFGITGDGAAAPSGTFVAYCFAAVAGYSAFGSYTGNGSTDGPFVYTGFRPRWVLLKRTDSTSNWVILDTSRNTYNVMNSTLWSDLSSAEGTYTIIDGLSNGFKLRESTNGYNNSSATYIYAAFAESPFKYALAR